MIVGIQESFIDYPGQICIMMFTRTCSWDCPGCYNKRSLAKAEEIPWEQVFDYLETSRPLTSHVTISGGEPTEVSEIPGVIRKLYSDGFQIKLDTNGSHPEVLKDILPYLEVVAMDIKTSLTREAYSEFVGPDTAVVDKVKESISLLSDWYKEDKMRRYLIFRTTLFNENVDTNWIEDYLEGNGIEYSEYIIQDDVRSIDGR